MSFGVMVIKAKLIQTAVMIWSAVVWVVTRFSGFFAPPHNLAAGRIMDLEQLDALEKSCGKQKTVVFFCSSAGEYEQAVPVIRRLAALGRGAVIFFFSPSGYRFASIREEPSPFYLAPPDIFRTWKEIFSRLNPTHIFVVRHELWPAFLWAARNSGAKLLLVNGSVSLRDRSSWFSCYLKSLLLQAFHRVYVVSERDFDFFVGNFRLAPSKLQVAGDSKYDQVYERAKGRKTAIEGLWTKLALSGKPEEPRSRMIVGSAWKPDYDLVLDALALIREKQPAAFSGMEVIIALHEPEQEALRELEYACQKRRFASVRFSQISPAGQDRKKDGAERPVILVDSIGLLSELYGCGNLALVGGALHAKIHNVLEPACYGLALAFGPHYKNSGEAVLLVENSCAQVVHNPPELFGWWISQVENGHAGGARVREHLGRFLGMSDRIVNDLLREMT